MMWTVKGGSIMSTQPSKEVIAWINEWLVSVERCEHGKIDGHTVCTCGKPWCGDPDIDSWCPGAGVGGDDETD